MRWFEDNGTVPTSNGVEYTTEYCEAVGKLTEDVTLDKDELYDVIEFIELNFIESIRNDTDIDNIDYIICMMNALQKFRNAYASIKLAEKSEEYNQEESK